MLSLWCLGLVLLCLPCPPLCSSFSGFCTIDLPKIHNKPEKGTTNGGRGNSQSFGGIACLAWPRLAPCSLWMRGWRAPPPPVNCSFPKRGEEVADFRVSFLVLVCFSLSLSLSLSLFACTIIPGFMSPGVRPLLTSLHVWRYFNSYELAPYWFHPCDAKAAFPRPLTEIHYTNPKPNASPKPLLLRQFHAQARRSLQDEPERQGAGSGLRLLRQPLDPTEAAAGDGRILLVEPFMFFPKRILPCSVTQVLGKKAQVRELR